MAGPSPLLLSQQHAKSTTDTEGLEEERSVAQRLKEAAARSLVSRYMYASLLYVVYCVGIFFVNYGGYRRAEVNELYLIWGVIHLVDAFLYAWAWKGRDWKDPVLYPEYLNLLGAGLYMWSATLYPSENVSDYSHDDVTYSVHVIETCASAVELVATIGWTWSWWVTFPRIPGRGATLDDPDVWSILTLYVGAFIYFLYNIQNLMDPSSYATNNWYMYGDIFYFLNSVLYLVSCMRDDGWFWFMPVAGLFIAPSETRRLNKALLRSTSYGTKEESLLLHIRVTDDGTSAVSTTTSSSAPVAMAF